MNKKRAFTLAEILITLTILGVVAAIVISSIVKNHEKTANMVKLKKYYAYITNNIEQEFILLGCNSLACISQANNAYDYQSSNKVNINNLRPFFPNIEQDSKGRCIPQKVYSLNGREYGVTQSYDSRARVRFCLTNNSDVGITVWDYTFTNGRSKPGQEGRRTVICDSPDGDCGRITLYLGGGKKKAIMGRNTFEFIIRGNGTLDSINTDCNPRANSATNGLGCASRIMRNNWKMDY